MADSKTISFALPADSFASFNDEDTAAGDESLDTKSGGGSSVGSTDIGSFITPVTPIFIGEANCRAITVHTETGQDLVCKGLNGCRKAGHADKRVNGRQGLEGFYFPLMSKNQKVLGGLLDSHMTSTEAELFRKSQLQLDRARAREVVNRSTPDRKPAVTNVPSDDSSPESWVQADGQSHATPTGGARSGGPAVDAMLAVTKNLAPRGTPAKGASRSTSPLQGFMNQSSRFQVGDMVWYTPARGKLDVFQVITINWESDSGVSRPVYSLQGSDGKEYDTYESRLQVWKKPIPVMESEEAKLYKHQVKRLEEEFKARELLQARQFADLQAQLSKLSTDLERQRNPTPPLSSLQQSVAANRASGTAVPQPQGQATVGSPIPSETKWYAVAHGKDMGSVGVYSSWAAVHPEVHGISGAVYARFGTPEAAQRFILEHQMALKKSAQVTPPSVEPAIDQPPSVSASPAAPASVPIHPSTLNWLGGRSSEPDKKIEGKAFGFDFSEEMILRENLVPEPKHMGNAVARHLCEQLLDIVAQPNTVGYALNEHAEQNAVFSRALLSLTGAATDMSLGGAPQDMQWRNLKRITISDLKNREAIEDRIKDLRDGQRLVEATLKANLASVLLKAGYDHLVAQEWASQSYLYRMSCEGLEYYIQMHQCFLTLAISLDGGFDQAKLEIEHHTKALRSIRLTYGTRLQVCVAQYAYLRDQVSNNFRSIKLQEHLQREQSKLINKQATQLSDLQAKFARLEQRGNGGINGGVGNGGGIGGAPAAGKERCFHCGHHGVHAGGKNECPWKDIPKAEARAEAAKVLSDRRNGGNGAVN